MAKSALKLAGTMPTPTPTPTPPMPVGNNRAAAQSQMFSEIDALGEIEGRAGNSRSVLAVRCVEWAAQGVADVSDAAPIYDRYIKKAEDIAAVFGGLKAKKDPESGYKQNVSKVRQFLKMGGLKTIDPVRVINIAAAVVKDARSKGTIGCAPFDALLNIARKQCTQTQTELTADEMLECNQRRAPGDVIEADALGLVVGALEKYERAFGAQQETTEALEQLSSRIESLGGTTAQKKERERARKKAEKDAAKKVKK